MVRWEIHRQSINPCSKWRRLSRNTSLRIHFFSLYPMKNTRHRLTKNERLRALDLIRGMIERFKQSPDFQECEKDFNLTEVDKMVSACEGDPQYVNNDGSLAWGDIAIDVGSEIIAEIAKEALLMRTSATHNPARSYGSRGKLAQR